MEPKEIHKFISSILLGLIFFVLLAFLFGGQGHRFLAFLTIFGIIFFAFRWSKLQQELSNVKTETDKTNPGDPPMKYDSSFGKAEIPESFNINFIESQALKIQNNPSLIASYFTALKTEFHLANQISVINRLESYNRAVASGVDSQTEILKKKKDFLYAKKDLLTVEDDLEVQQLEKELTKTDLQLKIEIKQQEREDIKKQSKDTEDYDL